MNRSVARLRLLQIIGLAALLAVPCFAAATGNNTWLLGQWELTDDPDGSPRDVLVFDQGGRIVSISEDERRTLGAYFVTEDDVMASFPMPGDRSLSLHFVPTPDHRQLKVRSSRTGNVATYTKTHE